jgi:hypothetical protein
VLVELEPEELCAGVHLVTVHACGEGRLLQLLPHGLRLEPVEPGRPDEPAGVDESRQLVAGEERLLEQRLARQREVLGMGEHGSDHDLGIALLTQDRRAVLRMLVERGVDLVVEIVQQRDGRPELLVLAEALRIAANGGLDGQGMTQERLALRVARQGLRGVVTGDLHGAGYDTAPLCSRS